MGLNRNPIVTDDLSLLTSTYPDIWDRLNGKTILITGAAGLLAAYMVETVLFLNETKKLNAKVIAVGRNINALKHRFSHYANRNELLLVEHDVIFKLELDLKIDFVIHAASQASPKYYSIDPIGTINANTLGTSNLLDLAWFHNVESFLYFSSAEIYGDTPHIPTAENNYGYLDPLNVRSCYAESKRTGENMCVSWHHQNDVPAKIVRPFHTYGPYMKLNDGRVYADLVSDALTKDTIVLKSDGLAMRSFCYLADATAGFWLVLLNGINAQAYNIGNPDGLISIRDLADLIAGLSPAKKLNVISKLRKDGDPYMISKINVSQPDISKAMNLGWRPYTSLAEGFRKTIESYKL